MESSKRAPVGLTASLVMVLGSGGGIASCASAPPAPADGSEAGVTWGGSSEVGPLSVTELTPGYEVVSASSGEAPDVEALIQPFRSQMESQLSEVLGEASGPFAKADPEGTLDNLVSDAVLDEVQSWVESPVDVVLLNDGGLRVPIPAGPIQVRTAYELLPFENYITVLTFSGAQLEALADQIARTGGEPIAGWTMVLEEDDAMSVLVAGEPVDPEGRYRLATVDYMANGGGSWSVLWEPLAREDLPMLIRDLFMAYVREEGQVAPVLDGRITVPPGSDRGGVQSPGGAP